MARQILCLYTSCEVEKCVNLLNYSVTNIREDTTLTQRGEGSSSLSLPIPTEAAPDLDPAMLADIGCDASDGLQEHLTTHPP